MKKRPLNPRDVPSVVDKAVRDAEARGDFENLPGLGKPIPGLNRPHDELWWLKQMLQREDLAFVPDSLALRRELDAALAKIQRAPSEAAVRRIVTEINARIGEVNRTVTSGPGSNVAPVDEEALVANWRARKR